MISRLEKWIKYGYIVAYITAALERMAIIAFEMVKASCGDRK